MPSEPVDLTNCDREPIHIPGAIQPHGVLLACRGDAFTVVQVSENSATHLGLTPDRVIGRALCDLLSAASWGRLQEAAASGLPREANPVTVEAGNGAAFDAIAHYSATTGVAIVELEPRVTSSGGFHPGMRRSVRHLQSAATLQHLFEIGAREVRALTGFDRVMVYRFDRDWNGDVVAEDRHESLEPFLGLHYPAADIPAQARRLDTLNSNARRSWPACG